MPKVRSQFQPEPDPLVARVQQPQQQIQYPSYPQQQPFYPPEQQQWLQPPMIPMQPQKPPKKSVNRKVGIGCGVAAVALVLIIAISIAAQGNAATSSSTNSSTPAAQTTSANDPSTPTPQPTVVTPEPTVSAAELESVYKASTTDTTVATLDKDGNADSGKDVHFTATIMDFVKDNTGNTAGANVDDQNAVSGVVQIAFPTGTDLSQLNVGDVLEVWGTDGGTSSGQNSYGATIQEVGISANYLNDKTTGYQTH